MTPQSTNAGVQSPVLVSFRLTPECVTYSTANRRCVPANFDTSARSADQHPAIEVDIRR